MAELSEPFFNRIVSKGLLLRYAKNDVIWVPPRDWSGGEEDVRGGAPCERNGIFVVIAGLVSRSFKEADGKTEVEAVSDRVYSDGSTVSIVLQE